LIRLLFKIFFFSCVYIYIYTRANLHPGCRVKFYTQQ
jgi:hypothetical protein